MLTTPEPFCNMLTPFVEIPMETIHHCGIEILATSWHCKQSDFLETVFHFTLDDLRIVSQETYPVI
jgi:hypothetical protein